MVTKAQGSPFWCPEGLGNAQVFLAWFPHLLSDCLLEPFITTRAHAGWLIGSGVDCSQFWVLEVQGQDTTDFRRLLRTDKEFSWTFQKSSDCIGGVSQRPRLLSHQVFNRGSLAEGRGETQRFRPQQIDLKLLPKSVVRRMILLHFLSVLSIDIQEGKPIKESPRCPVYKQRIRGPQGLRNLSKVTRPSWTRTQPNAAGHPQLPPGGVLTALLALWLGPRGVRRAPSYPLG